MKFGTKVLHTGNEIDKTTGAVSIPIYQVSTFKQPDIDNFGPYDYARSGNPTREAIEGVIAQLEGGTHGFAFASGMAAISSVLLLFSPGDHLLVCQDVYGGTYRALTRLFSRLGVEATFVDTTDPEQVKAAIKANTKAIYLESPSNPLLKITDLRAMVEIAREQELLTIIDNTFLTPYYQRPLELGLDIVIHSATKYIGGHSDVIAGLVVVKDKKLAAEIKFIQNSFGAVLGPQDSWLLLRGVKTLKVRMDHHQAAALTIARWLQQQPEISQVFYPGLPDHPGYEVNRQQATGFGGIVSFKTQTDEQAKRIMNNVKLPALAVSLGSVESILSFPPKMSHAGMPQEVRHSQGITDNLLRLSVGLEEAEDLISDLEQALRS
ncbi:MAG TPA: aminotransferase class I/II-fold pyridoxal phosphate-dependent enzyme [Bacillota bacterium]|nr:aminotransferase class I/II-fold pyridoxal phosphate-dependent enzyme [Bacillota bacterium]